MNFLRREKNPFTYQNIASGILTAGIGVTAYSGLKSFKKDREFLHLQQNVAKLAKKAGISEFLRIHKNGSSFYDLAAGYGSENEYERILALEVAFKYGAKFEIVKNQKDSYIKSINFI